MRTNRCATFILFLLSIQTSLYAANQYNIEGSANDSSQIDMKLKKILADAIDSNDVFGVAFAVSTGDSKINWSGASGNMKTDTKYTLASVTKLFTGAVVYKLIEEGRLNLNDTIGAYVDSKYTDSIHIYDGVDYSKKLTIKQLLSHTSGLPDYYTEAVENQKSKEEIRKEHDQYFSVDEIFNIVRKLKPHFKPGQAEMAFYSDANYQLLGLIIENVTGIPLAAAYNKFVFDQLGLKNTYLQEKNMKAQFAPYYYKGKPLSRPLFVASLGPDGGIVSNINDMMIFLKAYFNGKLFPKSYLSANKEWNPIQFVPIKYGTNLMKFGNMIGHSGTTGTIAYYLPEYDLYIIGATGQLDTRKAMMLAVKIVSTLNFQFRMD